MIVARVRRTLTDRELVRSGEQVLVGCSGGADSVALVRVLARLARPLGLTLVVASVDHGLRPEAAAEVAFVRELAHGLELPFRALRVEIDRQGSLQASARVARYEALLACAREVGASRVAVGHTQEDQAETVLSRLLRGAGLAGLSGIDPARADGVIRPLIDCRRSDVRAYLQVQGQRWIEDPSNQDPRFERVRLRAAMQTLQAEDPQLVAHLADLADEARATRTWLSATLPGGRRSEPPIPPPTIAGWRAMAPPRRTAALRTWLAEQTGRAPRRVHLDAVEHLIRSSNKDAEGQEVLLGGGFRALLRGDRLVVEAGPPRPIRRAPRCDDRATRTEARPRGGEMPTFPCKRGGQ